MYHYVTTTVEPTVLLPESWHVEGGQTSPRHSYTTANLICWFYPRVKHVYRIRDLTFCGIQKEAPSGEAILPRVRINGDTTRHMTRREERGSGVADATLIFGECTPRLRAVAVMLGDFSYRRSPIISDFP